MIGGDSSEGWAPVGGLIGAQVYPDDPLQLVLCDRPRRRPAGAEGFLLCQARNARPLLAE